ncbi:energy-coupling factor transporter transmembrane component T family protein [Paenibacillus yanchengensis]|uniref:Energy-coupling factor transporter transmembrane component T family protein n=1 Tax=Paenibacillus yanchengensis TaxID=2035833 RepID=A0ABW4YPM3_9BACL
MNNRLIIGRYIVGDSFIHRLDPRSKLIGMFLFMIAIFLVNSYTTIVIALLFTTSILLLSKIPLLLYLKAIRPLLFLLIFISLFHVFFHNEGSRLLQAGNFAIYSGGLEKGLVSAGRMTLFITFAAMLSFTTQPDSIATGLSSILKPLNKLRIPVARFSLMLSIALRFIPTIFEEAERIWKAQVSRGFSLANKPLKEKAQLIIALLVPVTQGAFRRAISLADSMEARNYRLDHKRTAYRQMTWTIADSSYLCMFIIPIVLIAVFQKVF